MEEITLRSYQKELIKETRTGLKLHNRVIMQAPTGAGKGIIFGVIALQSEARNSKVLIMSNRTKIFDQNEGVLKKLGIKKSYINPNNRNIPKNNISVGMAQTLKKRVDKPEWIEYLKSIDLLIIDECHECVHDFIFDFISPKCFVIGCTATPHRTKKQKQLGFLYNAIISYVSIQELIEMRYLTPARHFSLVAPKLDDVTIDSSNGDYNQKQLAKVYESKQIYTGVVSEYKRITPNEKAICFCISSTQAIAITQEFIDNGVSAKYVLSGTFEGDKILSGNQDEIFEEFAKNKFKVLVNVGIAVAGFDCPDIKVCILNYSTLSITKYLQSIGRGARIAPNKKDFFILDFGNNIDKHGLYEQDRNWSLWHDEGSNGGLQPSKLCDPDKPDINGKKGCGRLVPMSCKICPACGRVFITEKHEYQLYLEEVKAKLENINECDLTVGEWALKMKAYGWNTNRILVQVCLKNVPKEKAAFLEAAMALKLSEKYWYFFSRNIWNKIKYKK